MINTIRNSNNHTTMTNIIRISIITINIITHNTMRSKILITSAPSPIMHSTTNNKMFLTINHNTTKTLRRINNIINPNRLSIQSIISKFFNTTKPSKRHSLLKIIKTLHHLKNTITRISTSFTHNTFSRNKNSILLSLFNKTIMHTRNIMIKFTTNSNSKTMLTQTTSSNNMLILKLSLILANTH